MKGLTHSQHKFMLEQMTGSTNVYLDDNDGIPSAMVRIPRFNMSDVISGAPDTPHPMFIINGVVKDEIYVGKYLANIYKDRAYSLPGRTPINNVSLADAVKYTIAKGDGWHVMTNAEFAGLALWAKAFGKLPGGNTNNGKNYNNASEYGTLTKSANIKNVSGDAKDYQTGYLYDMYYHIGTYTGTNIIRLMGEYQYPLEEKTSTVKKRGVAIDKDRNVYVCNTGTSSITKYFAGNKLKDITVGGNPVALAIDSECNVWGICGGTTGILFKVVGDTQVSTVTLTSVSSNREICIDTDKNIWVSSDSENKLYKINPLTLDISQYTGFNGIRSVMAHTDGYIVASLSNTTDKAIVKINQTDGTVIKKISVPDVPYNLGKDLFGNIFVSLREANKIVKVDMATDTIVKTIDITGPMAINFNLNNDMYVTSKTGRNISVFRDEKLLKVIQLTSCDIADDTLDYTGDTSGIIAAQLHKWKLEKHFVNRKIEYLKSASTEYLNVSNAKKIRIDLYGDSTFTSKNHIAGDFIVDSLDKLIISVADGNISVRETLNNSSNDLISMTTSAYKLSGNNFINANNKLSDNFVIEKLSVPPDTIKVVITVLSLNTNENRDDKITIMPSRETFTHKVRQGAKLNININTGFEEFGKIFDPVNYTQSTTITKTLSGLYSNGFYGECMINDDGVLKVWATVSNAVNERIMYTESIDNGVTWSAPTLAIDCGGTYNTYCSNGPCVVKVDGKYRMIFNGVKSSSDRTFYLLSSESPDGINWSAPTLVRGNNSVPGIDTYGIAPGTLIYDNGKYRLYGSGPSTIGTGKGPIIYMESSNFTEWTLPKITLPVGGNIQGMNVANSSNFLVTKINDVYVMIFLGYDSASNRNTLYSMSKNGLDWTVPRVMCRNRAIDIAGISRIDNTFIVVYCGMTYTTNIDMIDIDPTLLGDKVSFDIDTTNDINVTVNNDTTIGQDWCNFSRVIANGGTSYNSNRTSCPFVIKDGDKWKMWFAGYNGSNYRILYSTSTDGITWTTPILSMNIGGSSYNSLHSFAPSIIKESDNLYKMWFIGSNGTNYRILYSTSTDGITWTTPILSMNIGGTSYNSTHSAFPDVIKESDNLYKMWFSGSNGTNYRILYSTSTDGITWNTPILVIDIGTNTYIGGAARCPRIIKESDKSYKIWFVGGESGSSYTLNYSESTDGIHWAEPKLILSPENFSSDPLNVVYPFVMKDSDRYVLYYTGDNTKEILRAECQCASIIKNSNNEEIMYYDRIKNISKFARNTVNNFDIIRDGSNFNLYFSKTVSGADAIYSTTSTDLRTWSEDKLVVPSGFTATAGASAERPCVIKDGSIYKMWFTGYTGALKKIYYTTSTDNLNWSTPVLVMDINTTTDNVNASYSPYVIKDGATYKMWFIGLTGTITGVCYTESSDGTTWTNTVSLGIKNGFVNCEKEIKNLQVTKYKGMYKLLITAVDNKNKVSALHCDSIDGKIFGIVSTLMKNSGGIFEMNESLNGHYRILRDSVISRIFYVGGTVTSNIVSLLHTEFDDNTFTEKIFSSAAGKTWDIPDNMVSQTFDIVKENDHIMIYTSKCLSNSGTQTNSSIYMLESFDNGVSWADPVLCIAANATSYNVKHTFNMNVVKENGNYHMYFIGKDGTEGTYRAMYSKSTDGKVWSTPALAYPDNIDLYVGRITRPVKYNNEYYLIMYTGTSSTRTSELFKSTDLSTWTKVKNLPLPTDPRCISMYIDNRGMITVVLSDASKCTYYRTYDFNTWSVPEDVTLPKIPSTSDMRYQGFMFGETESLMIIDENKFNVYGIKLKDVLPVKSFNRNCRYMGDDRYNTIRTNIKKGSALNGYNINRNDTPCIIKDGDIYKMWFAGLDSSNISRILYSESRDCKEWTTPTLALNYNITPPSDSSGALTPYVIKDNNIYKMWYAGYDGTKYRILYTSSVDGKNWNTPSINIDTTLSTYSSVRAYYPCIIRDTEKYKMWYVGFDETTSRLLYTESIDGTVWTQPIVTLEKNVAAGYGDLVNANPRVIKVSNSSYKLYFSGIDSSNRCNIINSTSTDGKVWNSPKVIVKSETVNVVLFATVIRESNYKMIYNDINGTFNYITSEDGINWIKQSVNGIVVENLNIKKQNQFIIDNTVTIENKDTLLRYLFKNGDKVRFDCTGNIKTFDATNIGKLKVECFGASGGASSYAAGKGGYTYGILDTYKTNKFYIVVGGKGCSYTQNVKSKGTYGYNGGATLVGSGGNYEIGGGATDIRTKLKDYYSRLIVAAGGGTADEAGVGGNGGGWSGTNGTGSQATAGTQTSGGTSSSLSAGAFGLSLDPAPASINSSGYGMGGSGYYGGASSYTGGGGGGSSYVAGNPNCPTPHIDGIKLESSGTQVGMNTGDGYIILSVVETVGDDGSKMVTTGSGPITWNIGESIDGVADMNGNLSEMVTGLKCNNKIIYVIKDNDAAMQTVDISPTSPSWKMIDTNGNYIDTGTGIAMNYTVDLANIDFKALAMTLTPYLAKALGLVPVDTTTANMGYVNAKIVGEYMPLRGGHYNSLINNGIFNLALNSVYGDTFPFAGFRICYYKP